MLTIVASRATHSLEGFAIQLWKSLAHKPVVFRRSASQLANLGNPLSTTQRPEPPINLCD